MVKTNSDIITSYCLIKKQLWSRTCYFPKQTVSPFMFVLNNASDCISLKLGSTTRAVRTNPFATKLFRAGLSKYGLCWKIEIEGWYPNPFKKYCGTGNVTLSNSSMRKSMLFAIVYVKVKDLVGNGFS